MTRFKPATILGVLDRCAESFSFPMLDNGYVYPAAARLSLFRSATDWAIVIETFGYMYKSGLPDTTIQTFASRLHKRDSPKGWASRQAYQNYLRNNPHNEYRSAYPIKAGAWQDQENLMLVAADAQEVRVRRTPVSLPPVSEYAKHGIMLEESPRVQVHELCRYLAAVARDQVLATQRERRVSVLPGMMPLLLLDDWHHPNLADEERPGDGETFQQIAKVLSTGDVSHYRPTEEPNTHWRNWPAGGTL